MSEIRRYKIWNSKVLRQKRDTKWYMINMIYNNYNNIIWRRIWNVGCLFWCIRNTGPFPPSPSWLCPLSPLSNLFALHFFRLFPIPRPLILFLSLVHSSYPLLGWETSGYVKMRCCRERNRGNNTGQRRALVFLRWWNSIVEGGGGGN